MLAGVDCGFSIHVGMGGVDPDVIYAKLGALAEGARIASRNTGRRRRSLSGYPRRNRGIASFTKAGFSCGDACPALRHVEQLAVPGSWLPVPRKSAG